MTSDDGRDLLHFDDNHRRDAVFFAISSLGDDSPTCMTFDDASDTRAHHGVIISDQDAGHDNTRLGQWRAKPRVVVRLEHGARGTRNYRGVRLIPHADGVMFAAWRFAQRECK